MTLTRMKMMRNTLRGAYFAVITFGLTELVLHSITYVEKTVFETAGRIISDAPENDVIYWTVLGITLLAIATAILVRSSRLGFALSGIGGDEERAQTLGVNTRRIKVIAFSLSAFFPGALGAAMAVRWTYIEPLSVFNPFIGFQTVLIAMVGGAQTLIGPIVSSVFFASQTTLRSLITGHLSRGPRSRPRALPRHLRQPAESRSARRDPRAAGVRSRRS